MGNILISKSRLNQIIKDKRKNEGLTSSGYSIEEMTQKGEELRGELCNAILRVIPSFDVSAIQVIPPAKSINDSYTVKIVFPDEALQRKSLWTGGDGKHMGYTGEGVYDLIGLFTNGYTANRRVFGYWVGHGNDRYYGSKVHREPSSFISETIRNFTSRYPNIKVRYPQEWGG